MALSDLALRQMKPGVSRIRKSVGGSLSFVVEPDGRKWWYFSYRFGGKQKSLSMGVYPEVSLKDACQRRDEARKQLDDGLDPSACRKINQAEAEARAVNTFEAVALEWFEVKRTGWASGHADHIMSYFTRDVFPWMGSRPVAEITPAELLRVVRRVEERAIPTAHRVLGVCGEVFRYAVGTGRAGRDPSADLRGTLKPKPKEKNRASVTVPEDVGKLLRALDQSGSGFPVRCALRLAPYLFCRPGELVEAEWCDIDLDRGEWSFHVSKVDLPHVVPLPTQAVEILRELYHLTGRGRWVFAQASNPGNHISTDTVRLAVRSCGVAPKVFTPHGFRAMARTLLHEVLHFRPEVIEKQLSHAVPYVNETAYNRNMFIEERRKMMQEWADYLDSLKSGNIRAGAVA